MQDFRIKAAALASLKLKKLRNRLGDEGLLSLVTIWAYTAEHKPEGTLTGCTAEDIEEIAEWSGKPGALICALQELRLIDHDEVPGFSIHDWLEHNPFAATGKGTKGATPVDFRVAVSFKRHPQMRKLRAAFGADGVICLLRLWAFAAVYRTDGNLGPMNFDDVAAAAEWMGDDDAAYVTALIDLGLLESDGTAFSEDGETALAGTVRIHDWEHWNGFRFHAAERRQKAKKAAEARWKSNSDAVFVPPATAASRGSSAPAPDQAVLAPSPVTPPASLSAAPATSLAVAAPKSHPPLPPPPPPRLSASPLGSSQPGEENDLEVHTEDMEKKPTSKIVRMA